MDTMMMFTALLPMKGHSERIKNKNIREFCGRPLFQYVLDTLLHCPYVSEILVDTDSGEIVERVHSFSEKVKTIARPENLMGDMVSMNDIIQYDMMQSENDYFIQVHATSPLLSVDTLNEACRKFCENIDKYDSLFSVNQWQTRLYRADAAPLNHNPKELIRTQDLEPIYEENSNVYLFSRSSFEETKARIGRKPQMFVMDKLESVDIDEEQDFILAEQIYRMKHKIVQ